MSLSKRKTLQYVWKCATKLLWSLSRTPDTDLEAVSQLTEYGAHSEYRVCYTAATQFSGSLFLVGAASMLTEASVERKPL